MPDPKKPEPPISKKVVQAQLASNTGLAAQTAQLAARGDKSVDHIPTFLYYAKAVKEGNAEAAQRMLHHIGLNHGVETMNDVAWMGRDLAKTSLNVLAQRQIGVQKNEKIRRLYHMVNETPDLMNRFDFSMPSQEKPQIAYAGLDVKPRL